MIKSSLLLICTIMAHLLLAMHHISALPVHSSLGSAASPFRTVRGMDAESELTWMYLQRVLKGGAALARLPLYAHQVSGACFFNILVMR
jgi:hypothetical protein